MLRLAWASFGCTAMLLLNLTWDQLPFWLPSALGNEQHRYNNVVRQIVSSQSPSAWVNVQHRDTDVALGKSPPRLQSPSEMPPHSSMPTIGATLANLSSHDMPQTTSVPLESQSLKFQQRVGALRQNKALMAKWSPVPGTRVAVEREGCRRFRGEGIVCGIEFPEHFLVRRWIPRNATVMEFGARYGTTSCEIAKTLNNSGRVVSVEPDYTAVPSLKANTKSNNCHVHILEGVLASKPMMMQKSGGGYGGRTYQAQAKLGTHFRVVPNFHFEEVEAALGWKVDTLLIDCEGCGQYMMSEIGPKIRSQIDVVLFEADMACDAVLDKTGKEEHAHCMNYEEFKSFLRRSGLNQVQKFNDCDTKTYHALPGSPCWKTVSHYAFIRPGSYAHRRGMERSPRKG